MTESIRVSVVVFGLEQTPGREHFSKTGNKPNPPSILIARVPRTRWSGDDHSRNWRLRS